MGKTMSDYGSVYRKEDDPKNVGLIEVNEYGFFIDGEKVIFPESKHTGNFLIRGEKASELTFKEVTQEELDWIPITFNDGTVRLMNVKKYEELSKKIAAKYGFKEGDHIYIDGWENIPKVVAYNNELDVAILSDSSAWRVYDKQEWSKYDF